MSHRVQKASSVDHMMNDTVERRLGVICFSFFCSFCLRASRSDVALSYQVQSFQGGPKALALPDAHWIYYIKYIMEASMQTYCEANTAPLQGILISSAVRIQRVLQRTISSSQQCTTNALYPHQASVVRPLLPRASLA